MANGLTTTVALSPLPAMRALLTSLLLLGLAPLAQAQQASKTLCVLVDRAWVNDDFLRGLRRPFQLKELPVEREGPKGHWNDAGVIPNTFRLAASSCPHQSLVDSLEAVPLGIGAVDDSRARVDYVVRIRVTGWKQMIFDYVHRPGDPPPSPEEEIHPIVVFVDVAMCAPDSLTATLPPPWVSTSVMWREKPKSQSRAQEIHGWLVGMAALQAVHRRLGLLPNSLDLVFESRGRNQ